MPLSLSAVVDAGVLKLSPLLLVRIHWLKSLGRPTGSLCSGFRILVEEGNTIIGPPPDIRRTTHWRTLTDVPSCVGSESDDAYTVTFIVSGVRINPLVSYRVSVTFAYDWDKAPPKLVVGPLEIEPEVLSVSLTDDTPIVAAEFEVVRGRPI